MAQRHTLSTRWNDDTEQREWAITIVNFSRARDAIGTAALRICELTGHRIEEWFTFPVAEWAFRTERQVLLTEITEDDAFLVNPKWVTQVKRHDRDIEEYGDDE